MSKKTTARKAASQTKSEADIRLDKIEETVNNLTANISTLVDIVGRNARDVPVVIHKGHEAAAEDLGHAEPAHMTEDAGTSDEAFLVSPRPESFSDPAHKEKLANLAFMNELVTVHIHDTSEKNADPVFEIQVNGEKEFFIRGQKKTIKRYFAEGLARAKPVSYRNEEYTTSEGVRAVRWPSNRGLRYPFDVVEDRNPRGRSWLNSVLAQP